MLSNRCKPCSATAVTWWITTPSLPLLPFPFPLWFGVGARVGEEGAREEGDREGEGNEGEGNEGEGSAGCELSDGESDCN